MIPQRNLSLLSNELARQGGQRIPEAVLERDYCLSWFLVGMSQSPLLEILIFKGGTAIKKCYIQDYRFSEDLDFTLVKEIAFEEIQRGEGSIMPSRRLNGNRVSNFISAVWIGIAIKIVILFISLMKDLCLEHPRKK